MTKHPLPSARHAKVASHMDPYGESMSSMISGLQRQCDGDRRSMERRMEQLDRQFQGFATRLDSEHARDSDWREKWAEVQGSLNGLVEETQALARRVDGLDERLWSRASGVEELSRQGLRDLQQ